MRTEYGRLTVSLDRLGLANEVEEAIAQRCRDYYWQSSAPGEPGHFANAARSDQGDQARVSECRFHFG